MGNLETNKSVISLLHLFLLILVTVSIVLTFFIEIFREPLSLFIMLTIIIYFIMLNGFLGGRLKQYFECLYGGEMILVITLIFIFTGWKLGLFSILYGFISGAILIYLARKIASYLLRY